MVNNYFGMVFLTTWKCEPAYLQILHTQSCFCTNYLYQIVLLLLCKYIFNLDLFSQIFKKNYFHGYILLFYCHDKCVANSVHNLQLGWMNNLMLRVQLKCPTYANQRTLVWAIPAPFENKLAMWPTSMAALSAYHQGHLWRCMNKKVSRILHCRHISSALLGFFDRPSHSLWLWCHQMISSPTSTQHPFSIIWL